jgi:hypothetical protein
MGFGNANRTDGLLSKEEYKEFKEFRDGSQEDAATQRLEGSRFNVCLKT